MPRPRQYATDAERQRACRQRLAAQTVRVDRRALERLHAQLDQLQAAVAAAAQTGDGIARRCHAASVETMLERLSAHFQTVAATAAAPPARPPRC